MRRILILSICAITLISIFPGSKASEYLKPEYRIKDYILPLAQLGNKLLIGKKTGSDLINIDTGISLWEDSKNDLRTDYPKYLIYLADWNFAQYKDTIIIIDLNKKIACYEILSGKKKWENAELAAYHKPYCIDGNIAYTTLSDLQKDKIDLVKYNLDTGIIQEHMTIEDKTSINYQSNEGRVLAKSGDLLLFYHNHHTTIYNLSERRIAWRKITTIYSPPPDSVKLINDTVIECQPYSYPDFNKNLLCIIRGYDLKTGKELWKTYADRFFAYSNNKFFFNYGNYLNDDKGSYVGAIDLKPPFKVDKYYMKVYPITFYNNFWALGGSLVCIDITSMVNTECLTVFDQDLKQVCFEPLFSDQKIDSHDYVLLGGYLFAHATDTNESEEANYTYCFNMNIFNKKYYSNVVYMLLKFVLRMILP